MSTLPGSPSPTGKAADHGPGAASLSGIRIRPSQASETPQPARKRGDITLLLSKVSAKPQLSAPRADGASALSSPLPSQADLPAAADAAAPSHLPIDALVREPAGQARPAPDAIIDAEIVEPAAGAAEERAEQEREPPAGRSDDRRQYNAAGRRLSDIQGYWARLRDGRRWPAWEDMDAGMVAQVWPNSFLLTCQAGGEGGKGAPVVAQAMRVDREAPPAGSPHDLPITPAVIDWIRSVGAEVAASGLPARHAEQFGTPRGSLLLRLHALPLSDDQTRVDRVLCHVARASG
jgi:hypothetical protein